MKLRLYVILSILNVGVAPGCVVRGDEMPRCCASPVKGRSAEGGGGGGGVEEKTLTHFSDLQQQQIVAIS